MRNRDVVITSLFFSRCKIANAAKYKTSIAIFPAINFFVWLVALVLFKHMPNANVGHLAWAGAILARFGFASMFALVTSYGLASSLSAGAQNRFTSDERKANTLNVSWKYFDLAFVGVLLTCVAWLVMQRG